MNRILLICLFAFSVFDCLLGQADVENTTESEYYDLLEVNPNFHYPLIVVSLDGVRADLFEAYLKENPNSSFHTIINSGVKAEYMIPSFPTVTYPNHYTIVTGLYPESHGIVGNYMYDQDEDEKVNFISGGDSALDVKWWNKAEPIWLTAKSQNLKTYGSYWPGTNVITRSTDVWLAYDSTFSKTFNETYDINQRIVDTVNTMSKMGIDLTLFYTNQPDSAGHNYGPNTTDYEFQLLRNDMFVETLINSLTVVGVYDTTNIIILSDHGMTQTNPNCPIKITDYGLNETYINFNKSIFGIVSHIYAFSGYEQFVFNQLSKIANVTVYNKTTIPSRLHFEDSPRIADIIVISNEGYMLTYNSTCLKGDHGYDNELRSMRTIFMARGPNFAQNETLTPFKNVDVYPLLCELLKLECNPSNGTLRTFGNVLIDTSSATRYIHSRYMLSLLLFFFLFY